MAVVYECDRCERLFHPAPPDRVALTEGNVHLCLTFSPTRYDIAWGKAHLCPECLMVLGQLALATLKSEEVTYLDQPKEVPRNDTNTSEVTSVPDTGGD